MGFYLSDYQKEVLSLISLIISYKKLLEEEGDYQDPILLELKKTNILLENVLKSLDKR